MRKNIKVLPIPIHRGLNTEAPNALLLEDGEFTTHSNMREISGGKSKRYGISKIKVTADSDETETATGFFADYYAGAETLFRMDSAGLIKKCVSPAGAGADSWAAINTSFPRTVSTTRRWSMAKFNTYDATSGSQLEKILFTDNTDQPGIYDGTNFVSLASLCQESGGIPATIPDIKLYYHDNGSADVYNDTIIRLITEGGTAPSAITINLHNDGATCDTWTMGTVTYTKDGSSTSSFLTYGAVTGSLTDGDDSFVLTFNATGGMSDGTYQASIPLTFTNGASTKILTVILRIADSVVNTATSRLDMTSINYTCEQGSYPTVLTNYILPMIKSGAALSTYQVGAITYSPNAEGWLSESTSRVAQTGYPLPQFSVTVNSTDVANLDYDIYQAFVPVTIAYYLLIGGILVAQETLTFTITVSLNITNPNITEQGQNHYVPVKSKCSCVFAGRLLLGNITEKTNRVGTGGSINTSAVFKNRVVWSEYNDSTIFLDDSWEDLDERGGGTNIGLNSLKVFNGACYAFSDMSIHRINDSGDASLPYSFEPDILNIGCSKPETIVVTKNFIIFEASDGTKRAFDGFRSYILSGKILQRNKTDASSCACYDSTRGIYVYNSTGTVTKLGLIDLDVTYKLPSGGVSDAVSDLSRVEIYEHTYPNTMSFLSSTATNCYALCTNSTTFYVAKLFDGTKSTDFGTTAISFSLITKNYTLGPGLIGDFDYLLVRGVLGSTETIDITVTCQPNTESVTTTVTPTATGVAIPIKRSVKEFKITISNSTAVAAQCDLFTVEAVIHNIRREM